MKVAKLEVFPISVPLAGGQTYWGATTWAADRGRALGPYPPEARRRYVYSDGVETVLIRVESSDGVVGWGECKAPVASRVTASLVEELLAPMVIGSSLDALSVTWDRMYTAMRVRGHDSGFWLEALAGIDIALWDAWSRTLHQPLHALLGGAYREAVPVYASGIPAASASTEGQREVRRRAEELVGAGWSAAKVAIGVDPEADLASLRTVREVFGDRGRISADAAGAYDLVVAERIGHRLEELGIEFFEMPIPPEHVEGYATLSRHLAIPLALDSITNRYRALEYLRRGALQIVQPDVCRAGGITELMRIAMLADAFGAQATPHVSIGSAVHFAASLECALAIPNLAFLEHWTGDNPLGTPIADDLDAPADGVRRRPTAGPGLGISMREGVVRALAAGREPTPRT